MWLSVQPLMINVLPKACYDIACAIALANGWNGTIELNNRNIYQQTYSKGFYEAAQLME